MLKNRDSFYQNRSTIHNKSRQCNQNMFNILICGGLDKREKKIVSQVKEVNMNNFNEYHNFSSMLEERDHSKAVCLKGEVYVIGGFNRGFRIKSVEKYSPISKKWIKVTDMPDRRQYFCACAFMNKIYLFGGFDDERGVLNSYLKLGAKTLKWKKVAKMNKLRSSAACAIYEENIVVSGGIYNAIGLRTVDSYDVFGNVWRPMPNMIEERRIHSLISVKRKLFAIGGTFSKTNCEVYDKTSNMFVKLETPSFLLCRVKSVLVGSKIFFFQNGTLSVLCYDVDIDEWSQEISKAIENIDYYSTVKVPSY